MKARSIAFPFPYTNKYIIRWTTDIFFFHLFLLLPLAFCLYFVIADMNVLKHENGQIIIIECLMLRLFDFIFLSKNHQNRKK